MPQVVLYQAVVLASETAKVSFLWFRTSFFFGASEQAARHRCITNPALAGQADSTYIIALGGRDG